MSRALTHCVLSAALACTGVFHSIHVVADELPVVVVSAARTERSTLPTVSKITVISREDIENSSATNVAEVLRQHGGLVVSDIYGDGSSVGIGVRGFGESANANTLVMVDGRRLNNSDIASPDIYSVPLNNIERIEIVYGSAAVLFGDQATGGVINIITKDPHRAENQLEVGYGSYNTKEVKAYLSGNVTDNLGYKLIAEDRASDNYRDHNEKDFQQLAGTVDYQYDRGNVFAEFQYATDYLQTPGALYQSDMETNRRQVLPNIDNNYSDLKSNVGRVGVRHKLSDTWSLEAEATSRHTDGEFILGFANFPVTERGYQNREVTEFTPRIIGVLPYDDKAAILTLGIDRVDSDYFLTSILGDQRNDQQASSFYAQGILPLSKKVDLTLGFRRARVDNELVDTSTFTTGRNIEDTVGVGEVGFDYAFKNNGHFFVRVEENYRFPKVDEYTDPQYVSGSPEILETQTGVSYEMGVRQSFPDYSIDVSLFKLDLANEISYDPVAMSAFGPFGANVNIDSTERRGALLSATTDVGESFVLGLSGSVQHSEIKSGNLKGKDVPYVPEVQANLYMDYKATEKLLFKVAVQYTDERYLSGDYDNSLKKLPSYKVVHASTVYKQKNVTYKLRINNLLDEEYSEFGLSGYDASFNVVETYYPSPERNIMGSVTIGF